MLRVLLTVVLPLILPTALYLVWLRLARPGALADGVRWQALPFVWLAGAGAVLLALVLFIVSVHFGSPQQGTYVPPSLENGRVVPGHIEPKPGR